MVLLTVVDTAREGQAERRPLIIEERRWKTKSSVFAFDIIEQLLEKLTRVRKKLLFTRDWTAVLIGWKTY